MGVFNFRQPSLGPGILIGRIGQGLNVGKPQFSPEIVNRRPHPVRPQSVIPVDLASNPPTLAELSPHIAVS
jgi:hypothetical protein